MKVKREASSRGGDSGGAPMRIAIPRAKHAATLSAEEPPSAASGHAPAATRHPSGHLAAHTGKDGESAIASFGDRDLGSDRDRDPGARMDAQLTAEAGGVLQVCVT